MIFDLPTFRRQRDANGLRLMDEEIERNHVLYAETKLERKRLRLKNWLKLARLKHSDDGTWEHDLRLKRAEAALKEEDADLRGQLSFIDANIWRIRRLRDALAADVTDAEKFGADTILKVGASWFDMKHTANAATPAEAQE